MPMVCYGKKLIPAGVLGLSPRRTQLLWLILGSGRALTYRECEAATGLTLAAVTLAIRRMRAMGLVREVPEFSCRTIVPAGPFCVELTQPPEPDHAP